jgi:hypothetical protein
MDIGYSNEIAYGKHKFFLNVSVEDFYGHLPEPKIVLSINASVVADPNTIGRPMYFDTPKAAIEYGKHWVDYLSGN